MNIVGKIWAWVNRKFWTFVVKKRCSAFGVELKVNWKTVVTAKTFLGDHVNLNGMRIQGKGEVHIGSYFHSGIECMIISSNHNYDTGTAIPYDRSSIAKDVYIGDFVWIGNRVLILPGVTIGEGAVIQAGSVGCSNSVTNSILPN